MVGLLYKLGVKRRFLITTNNERGKKMTEVKCVVWDLDDTLWNGTLIEGDEIVLKEGMMEILKTFDERGILLSIASKNNYNQVMEELRKMEIEKYFLYPQINWNSKSNSIAEIQKKLNIGMNTILFIDDQAYERDEVKFQYPEVETVDAAQYKELLQMTRLNPKVVTADSRRRRLMYMEDKRRNDSEAAFVGPKSEFLKSLDMKFRISLSNEEDLQRLEELTRRTNQLNSTGIQYSHEELKKFMNLPEYDLWGCELEDKYGSYGKIGLSLVHKTEEGWIIKLLLMSCRTVSKGVGTVLLSFLMKRALEQNQRLFAEFKRTDRNRQMLITYQLANFIKAHTDGDMSLFENDLSKIQKFPDYIDVQITN